MLHIYFCIIVSMYILSSMSCNHGLDYSTRKKQEKLDVLQKSLSNASNTEEKSKKILKKTKNNHIYDAFRFRFDSLTDQEDINKRIKEKEHYDSLKEKMLKNLSQFALDINNEYAMQAISDALYLTRAKGFFKFYQPFSSIPFNMGHIYTENMHETFIIESISQQEIDSDENLKTKIIDDQKVFIYQYADHSPSILGDFSMSERGPRISGALYSIENKNDETAKVSGTLTLNFGADDLDQVRMIFGTAKVVKGSVVYENDILFNKDNTPLSGQFTLEYISSGISKESKQKISKIYDLSKLNDEEKKTLQHFKLFNIAI